MIDRMGGEVVTRALLVYIAAMIKHSGLLRDLISSPEPIPEMEQQLIQIWHESKKLRQWIGGERRRLLLEASNQGGETPSTIPDQEPDIASYEHLSEDLVSKMWFLLQIGPACGPVSAASADGSPSVQPKLKKRFINLPASGDGGSLEAWKELFNTWKNIQQHSSPILRRKQVLPSSIPDLIGSFARKASLKSLKELLVKRQARAGFRKSAFQVLQVLLTSLCSNSTKLEIIDSVASSLLSLQDIDRYSSHRISNSFSLVWGITGVTLNRAERRQNRLCNAPSTSYAIQYCSFSNTPTHLCSSGNSFSPSHLLNTLA